LWLLPWIERGSEGTPRTTMPTQVWKMLPLLFYWSPDTILPYFLPDYQSGIVFHVLSAQTSSWNWISPRSYLGQKLSKWLDSRARHFLLEIPVDRGIERNQVNSRNCRQILESKGHLSYSWGCKIAEKNLWEEANA